MKIYSSFGKQDKSLSVRENKHFSSLFFLILCSTVFCLSVPLVNQYTPPPFVRHYYYFKNHPVTIELCRSLFINKSDVPLTLSTHSLLKGTKEPFVNRMQTLQTNSNFSNQVQNFSQKITLYPRNNHLGTALTIFLTAKHKCKDVPNLYAHKILSVDTYGTCAYLYKQKKCQGKYVEISPGTPSHNRLRDVGLDKKTKSVGVCNK